MKFVLLGSDESLLPLLTAIEANLAHRIMAAASVTDAFAAALLAVSPNSRRVDGWDELHNLEFDAVIATAGDEERETGIKQLASMGKPLLLVPFSDPASAFIYELTLVRADTHGGIVPLFPLRSLAVIDELRHGIGDRRWGKVLNLQWSRRVKAEASVLPRATLHQHLIHDADLLRFLGGDYRQVTAVLSAPSPQEMAMATVTLAGEDLPSAVWTIRPVTRKPGWELVITTEQGNITLQGELASADHNTVGQLSASGIDIAGLRDLSATADANVVVNRFGAAVQGESASPTWLDMQRATEIVEAVERSVRRRRTIDLHFETTSERNQFKTQMTAIGCGLMSMTFFSLLFLLAAGALFKPHPLIMKIAQVGIVVPLVLFLLLQLLLFIARPSATESSPAETAEGTSKDDATAK